MPVVSLKKNKLFLKQLTTDVELSASFQLRYDVFSRELGWVVPNDRKSETDTYDAYADHLGILTSRGELVATARIINSIFPQMIEKEFSTLVGCRHKIRKDTDTAEISRLAIKKGYRSNRTGLLPLLHCHIHNWLTDRQIQYTYAVVEKPHYSMLKGLGFNCPRIGSIKTFDRGKALACLIDWQGFRQNYKAFIDIPTILYSSPDKDRNRIKESLQNNLP